MKLRIIDRILMALTGLILLALGAWVALDALGVVTPVSEVLAWLLNVQSLQKGLFVAGICAVLALLGICDVSVLFRRRKGKHGFIAQRSENGEISISVKSIESLVYKCAQKHGEIQVQSVSVEETRGGLLIKLRATLASGMNIPLAVGTLQKQVRQYITACSGVDVSEVQVKVESTDKAADQSPYAVPDAPAALPVEEPMPAPIPAEAVQPVEVPAELPETPAEPEERPVHQRMFSAVEEPNIVPEPPVQDVSPQEAIAAEAEQAAADAMIQPDAAAEAQQAADEPLAQPEQDESQADDPDADSGLLQALQDEIAAEAEPQDSLWQAASSAAEDQGFQWADPGQSPEPLAKPDDDAAQADEDDEDVRWNPDEAYPLSDGTDPDQEAAADDADPIG